MCALTWEDPKTYGIWTVNEANQKRLAKGNLEEIPNKSNSTTMEGTQNSLSLPVCISTGPVLFP